MTGSTDRSGRRSDRVDVQTTATTGFAGLHANTAPESMGTGRVPNGAASAERRTERVSARRLETIAASLTPRDRLLLRQLGEYRYLSTRQFQLLHFRSAATPATAARLTRRTLVRLRDHRLIEPLERRIGGHRAGSAGYIWRLASAGDQLRRDLPRARTRRKEPSTRHLDHTLAITDCYCQLVAATDQAGFELINAEPEPSSWRRYLGAGGSQEILKPDLYVVTAAGDFEDHWFLEIDRATESLPVVMRKCEQYEDYRRTGREQQDLGLFPRVLWVVPDDRRAAELNAGIASARLDPQLFQVAPAVEFTAAVLQGGAA